jgi:hypothetical protein
MMTTKPLLNFHVEQKLLDRVDAYWHKHKFPNRAAAVRWLLMYALAQNPKPPEAKESSK